MKCGHFRQKKQNNIESKDNTEILIKKFLYMTDNYDVRFVTKRHFSRSEIFLHGFYELVLFKKIL